MAEQVKAIVYNIEYRNTKFRLIERNKLRVFVNYSPNEKEIMLVFFQKLKNSLYKMFVVFVPEVMGQAVEKVFRMICRHRRFIIDKSLHYVILQSPMIVNDRFDKLKATERREEQIKTQPIVMEAFPSKPPTKSQEKFFLTANYEIEYWRGLTEIGEVTVVLDPHNKNVQMNILDRIKGVKLAQTTLCSGYSPLQKHQATQLVPLFRSIIASGVWFIDWQYNIFTNDDPLLLQVPLTQSLILPIQPQPQLSYKEKLFTHIFLSQVITHMIANKFGRCIRKNIKKREGYCQTEYIDEQLQELRNWGYRMNIFRDHPIKRIKKKKGRKEEDTYDSLDEEEQQVEEKENKCIKGDRKYQKKKQNMTKLEKMGDKIKKKKDENICNFTFMSGVEKSGINKMRYCLHQMARETDHTQAFMDFIRLVIHVEPIDKLLGNYDPEDGEEREKGSIMRVFMSEYKVRRHLKTCLKKYTEESFYHRVLNIGLRSLQQPYQLVYLRLPFSHLFWSIKFLYHRHKRAIFHHKEKKNQSRKIKLYRGCSLGPKEIDELKRSRGEYIEAEGFLSASLDPQIAISFAVNANIEIHVPASNLKSIFDNGFANITKFSAISGQKEILFNAFNVFKILGVKGLSKDGKEYMIYLEYGSIKSVEEKVKKKSANLVEEEFKWDVDSESISEAKIKLLLMEEQMTKKEYKKLMNMLPKQLEKIKKRKQKLDKKIEKEYQDIVEKLAEWDKELILNTKHQQNKISSIENYGDLLQNLGEFRKACVYFRKKIKTVELNKAVEGILWRTTPCLIHSEQQSRFNLSQCYFRIGRVANSWVQMQKLLYLYESINISQSEYLFISLLFNLFTLSNEIVNKEEEGKKYKKRIMGILKKENPKHQKIYERILYAEKQEKQLEMKRQGKKKGIVKLSKGEKKKAQEQEKQRQVEKKQEVKMLKKQLRDIRKYADGLYSPSYLGGLWQIIQVLASGKRWKQVIKQGNRYLAILSHKPCVETRGRTCEIFSSMLEACIETKQKEEVERICSRVAQYIRTNIYIYREYILFFQCINSCLNLHCLRAGRVVILKFLGVNVKCDLLECHVNSMMNLGYLLLLLSASKQNIINSFLDKINSLYQEQKYTNCDQYKYLQHIISYNKQYSTSDKGRYCERKKEYYDAIYIHHGQQWLKNGKSEWREYVWEEKKAELIPWKHPFHHLFANMKNDKMMKIQYISKGQVHMHLLHATQTQNLFYNIFPGESIGFTSALKYHLRNLLTVSKLHLNETCLKMIPSLLSFATDLFQLTFVQVSEIGLDIGKSIQKVQHLEEKRKRQTVQQMNLLRRKISQDQGVLPNTLDMERPEVRWMRHVYGRFQNHLFTKLLTLVSSFHMGESLTSSLYENAQQSTHLLGAKVQICSSNLSQKPSMLLRINLFLTILQFTDSVEYSLLSPKIRMTILFFFLNQYQTQYDTLFPRDLTPLTLTINREEVEFHTRKARTMGKLHMSDNKIRAISKIREGKKGPDEGQGCLLSVLLQNKKIPQKCDQLERQRWFQFLQQCRKKEMRN